MLDISHIACDNSFQVSCTAFTHEIFISKWTILVTLPLNPTESGSSISLALFPQRPNLTALTSTSQTVRPSNGYRGTWQCDISTLWTRFPSIWSVSTMSCSCGCSKLSSRTTIQGRCCEMRWRCWVRDLFIIMIIIVYIVIYIHFVLCILCHWHKIPCPIPPSLQAFFCKWRLYSLRDGWHHLMPTHNPQSQAATSNGPNTTWRRKQSSKHPHPSALSPSTPSHHSCKGSRIKTGESGCKSNVPPFPLPLLHPLRYPGHWNQSTTPAGSLPSPEPSATTTSPP